jgi:hypothetical protein
MRIHTRSCCDGLFRGLVVTIHRVELKPPPPPFIPHLLLDAIVGLPMEGHEKGQQFRGVCGFPHFRCGAGALQDPRLRTRRSTVGWSGC